MNPYHLTVLLGFALHLLQKYVIAPGWKPSDFIKGEWRYVVTSLVLTGMLAFYGPELLSTLGFGEEVTAMLKGSPKLLGTLIGLSGGSLAYNLPYIGPVVRDLFKPKQPDQQ